MFTIKQSLSPVAVPAGPDDVEVTIDRLEHAGREFTQREISNMRWMAAWCMGQAKEAQTAGKGEAADRLIAEAKRLLQLSGVPLSH